MKSFINIFFVCLVLTFVSVEAHAWGGIIKKAQQISKIIVKGSIKVPEVIVKGTLNPMVQLNLNRIYRYVEKNTKTSTLCIKHNKNINDKKYFNSLLEQLPKEDNENSDSDETLSSDIQE